MKNILTATALSCVLSCLVAAPSFADNSRVNEALQRRPDLSTFYQGLVSTGVIHELKDNQSYTVFAPTNEAFAKLSADKYPCFYSSECKAQTADILRNHIVAGENHVRDINTTRSAAVSLFSINDDHLIVSQPTKDGFAVDGKNIVSENQLAGGVLYKVDGVIATPRQLVQFESPQVAVVRVPGSDLPPRVPAGTIVTITTENSAHAQ